MVGGDSTIDCNSTKSYHTWRFSCIEYKILLFFQIVIYFLDLLFEGKFMRLIC